MVAVIDSETQIFSFISPCFKVRPPILWLKVRPLYPLIIVWPNFELIHQFKGCVDIIRYVDLFTDLCVWYDWYRDHVLARCLDFNGYQ